jgi:DNA-binding NarL/FixJ family response regulator
LRIFIVERHPLLLAGVQHLLSRRLDVRVVGHAPTPAEAQRYILTLRPDVVLIDLDDDLEAAEALTRHINDTSPMTIVIGMSDTDLPSPNA